MRDELGALPEVLEDEHRRCVRAERGADGSFGELPEVREQRLDSGDAEDDSAQDVVVLGPDEQHDRTRRIERAEDRRVLRNIDAARDAIEGEPEDNDRREEAGDALGAKWLDEEQHDEDAAGNADD